MKGINLNSTAWLFAGVFMLMIIAKFNAFQNNYDDIQLFPSIVDIGENLEGLTVEKTMRIKNSFGFDAKFDEVVIGCGCLSIWDGSDSLARPIDQTNFVVTAESERTIVARLNLEGLSGEFDRSFVFRSKDSRIKPIMGRITGKVMGRIRVSPKEVNLGEVPIVEKSFAFNLSGMALGMQSLQTVSPIIY